MTNVEIAGVFTILGGSIGAVATYITGVKTVKEHRFNMAADKFRSAIINELAKWHSPGRDIFHVNGDEFYKSLMNMAKAASIFSHDVEPQKYDALAKTVKRLKEFGWKANEDNAFNRIFEDKIDDPISVIDELSEIAKILLGFADKSSNADRIREKLKRFPKIIRCLKEYRK